MTKAVELSYQSSHINGKYGLRGMEATQMRLHGAIFGRLGNETLAEQYSDVIQNIHNRSTSKLEILNLSCIQAYNCALAGRYDAGLRILTECDPSQYRTLRLDNTFLGFALMIRFKRAIHRSDTIPRTADVKGYTGTNILEGMRSLRPTASSGN